MNRGFLKDGMLLTDRGQINRTCTPEDVGILYPEALKIGEGCDVGYCFIANVQELEEKRFQIYCRFQDGILVWMELLPLADMGERTEELYETNKQMLKDVLGENQSRDASEVLYEYEWGRIMMNVPEKDLKNPIMMEVFRQTG